MKTTTDVSFSRLAFLLLCLTLLPTVVEARRPLPKLEDFTKGGKPFDKSSFNVGPTGIRGWAYRLGTNTEQSRQIYVSGVAEKSPADGVFKVGDVILGADGQGATPEPFSTDSRLTIAKAIMEAEARDPAVLKLLRWRAGSTAVVELNLQPMGTYSETAPYNCEKSRNVLIKGLKALYEATKPGAYGLGILPFIAADDPSIPNREKYQEKAREWAKTLVRSDKDIELMKAGKNVFGGKEAWSNAYSLVVLAEYYLKTKDETVFPSLEAYAIAYAKNQSWYGTTGHIYATKNSAGSNGPMSGYGAINGSGVAGFYGLVLADKAGVKHEQVGKGIHRSERFFASYAEKSGIPYGEHSYSTGGGMYDMNGKNATVALAFSLMDHRHKEARFFSKMTMASSRDRQISHAGPFFNYMWPALGAKVVGDKAVSHYFKRTSWLNDLDRQWDGKIVFSHYGVGSGGSYRNFPPEVTTLLTYALPFRQLYMTGKADAPSLHLSTKECDEVIASEDFKAGSSTPEQLVEALTDWSPVVRYTIFRELKDRFSKRKGKSKTEPGEKEAIASKIRPLLKDPDASRVQLAAACFALGSISDDASAPLFAKLLESDDTYVRFAAAYALRYISPSVAKKHLDAIMIATATTLKPAFPFDDDDPIQFAHYQLSSLLFYNGNAYGPRGLLAGSIEGVDRKRLWPALRACAKTPAGHGRGGAGGVFKKLTEEEVITLADAIIEAVRVTSPADAMFSNGVRKDGIQVLQQHNIAEGVGVCEALGSRMVGDAAKALTEYGGSALDVYPEIMPLLYYQLGVRGAKVQGAIDAIVLDESPKKLKMLKGIRSVVAEPAVFKSPQTQTTLTADAYNHAVGRDEDNIYTWRKVYGAGEVSFKPNGTWDSKTTNVEFTGKKPGTYRFEVVMTDTLGYTSASAVVDITYNDSLGKQPKNQPPTVIDERRDIISGVTTEMRLSGSDPDGDDLAFIITEAPKHGKLSGQGNQLTYRSEYGYEGDDHLVYKVVDGQGVEALATVSLHVKKTPVGVTLYEPFEQNAGDLLGVPASPVGLKGNWEARNGAFKVFAENLSFPMLTSKGGLVRSLTGKRNTLNAKIDRDAFERDGLLADGGVLWMSFFIELRGINGIGSGYEIGLEHQADPKTNSIGSSFVRSTMRGFVNGVKGDTFIAHGPGHRVVPQRVPELVVAKITWGASSDAEDTVEIYRVLNIKTLGPVLLEKPVAIQKGIVDQSKLDSFFYRGTGDIPIDEIRMGPTYESVLLGTTSL